MSTERPPDDEGAEETQDDVAAALDMVLVQATAPGYQRWFPGQAGVKALAKLVRQPSQTSQRLGGLVSELRRIAAGKSEVAPHDKDRRFADPAWKTNPILRRAVQAYLALGATAEQLVDDADLDWAGDQRLRFALTNIVAAISPSNTPINPTALKVAVDHGALNFAKGAATLIKDLRQPPRIPEMVDTSKFEVGGNLAISPGSVVMRTAVFELIQYTPQTAKVRAVPLLIVPPTINKYYSLDLAPGRSFVEHLVNAGQQAFVMVWRNPDASHAEWGMDTYAQAILDALDATEQITGSEQTIPFALCGGGAVLAHTLGYMAATSQLHRLAGVAFGVMVIDYARAGTPSAFADPRAARAAIAWSQRRGYVDGRNLAEAFAWLRPDDLVWGYVVNNYLCGNTPPAFDLLYWNADTTRMTAGLHRDYILTALDNKLAAGTATALGEPVDLSKVDVDAYIVAGLKDHITPWENCYRTTQLLGGTSRFVLSSSGHIAAMVNPPGNPKSQFQVGEDTPASPRSWQQRAETVQGSWWDDVVSWLKARSGKLEPASTELGGGDHRPLAPAPGTYVFET